jgi:ATP-dependent RNA helicase DeaD
LGIKFQKAMIPAIEEIAKNRISHWAAKLADQKISPNLTEEMMGEANLMLVEFSKEELVAKFVSAQLDRISTKNSLNDLNDTSKGRAYDNDRGGDRGGRGGRRERDARGNEPGMSRYFINLGTMDQLNKGGLLRFICDNTGLKGSDIGRISLDQRHAYFDVTEANSGRIGKLDGQKFDGRDVRVNRDDAGGVKSSGGGGGGRFSGGGKRRSGGGGDRRSSGGDRRSGSGGGGGRRKRF